MAEGPAAGWYPDPVGGYGVRWWDGGRWTDATRDEGGAVLPSGGRVASAPDSPHGRVGAEASPDGTQPRRRGRWWLVTGVVILLIGGIAAASLATRPALPEVQMVADTSCDLHELEILDVEWATCLGGDREGGAHGESVEQVQVSPDGATVAVIGRSLIPAADNPLVSDGSDLVVWLLDVRNGGTIWHTIVPAAGVINAGGGFTPDGDVVIGGSVSKPDIDGNSEVFIWRINGQTGKLMWERRPGLVASRGAAMSGDSGTLLVATAGGVAGIDPATGQTQFQHELPSDPWQLHPLSDGVIAGSFLAGGWVTRIGSDGTIRWQRDGLGSMAFHSVAGDVVAVTAGQGPPDEPDTTVLTMIDLETGAIRWSEQVGGFDLNSSARPIAHPDVTAAVIGGRALGYSNNDGTQLWTATGLPECCDDAVASTDSVLGHVASDLSGVNLLHPEGTRQTITITGRDNITHHYPSLTATGDGTMILGLSINQGSASLHADILVARVR
jgi:outer membrane protein assembly factor BamB